MVVNEALASGLPVLGSVYSQAVEELCVEGETGWQFRPDARGEMEQALQRALETPVERLNEMRFAARARAAEITPQNSAERMVEAMKAALNRQGGRR